MTSLDARPNSLYSRRHVLTWAAAATVAAATSRLGQAALASNQATPEAGTSIFLDPALVHDISITFDQNVYDAMIETLSSSGEKEWIEAGVTIDGSSYDTAGIRLKGNSSLGGFGRPPADDIPEGAEPANGEDGPSTHVEGDGGELKTAEYLPWLIRLDKFVDNQQHEGITDLVIRSNRSETSLNEAVALDVLTLAGLDSQRAAATRFTANDSATVLRLAIELPNDAWMAAHFPAGGLLYKAEAGGDFSYRGDDPASYKDVFDLEAGGTGDDAKDMQPLFDFLAFLNDSDDETFAAEIPDHLDLDAFAAYLAMMELIGNHDDISGPGNNAYLHVGPDATMFKVVPWDMNLAFETFDRSEPGDGDNSDGSSIFGLLPDLDLPGGENRQIFEGTPPAGMECPDDQCAVRVAGPGMTNKLVERCNAAPGFTDLVDETRTRLHDELYESETAAGVLAQWVGVLRDQASDMVDDATLTTEADAIAEYFTREP
jgi:spore coat protein CotH